MKLEDDVLCAGRVQPGAVMHRPSTQDAHRPACGADATQPYGRHGAYRARMEGAELCHDRLCFPKGWASE